MTSPEELWAPYYAWRGRATEEFQSLPLPIHQVGSLNDVTVIDRWTYDARGESGVRRIKTHYGGEIAEVATDEARTWTILGAGAMRYPLYNPVLEVPLQPADIQLRLLVHVLGNPQPNHFVPVIELALTDFNRLRGIRRITELPLPAQAGYVTHHGVNLFQLVAPITKC